MTKNNKSTQETLITPEQLDKETSKTMLKRQDNFLDSIKRIVENAMQYQEQPVEVLRADDIERVINAQLGGMIQKMEKTLALYKPKIVIPAPSPEVKKKWYDRVVDRIVSWWNSRKGFWWRFGIFCATLGATILVGLYNYRWSDDAWARRAYDVASTVDGEDNPGRYYQWARETFDSKGRKAAKDRILRLEDKARELNGESR